MHWKEVSIAFEYDDLFDISNELQNAKSSKEIIEIFVEFINSIQPYYAISALEIYIKRPSVIYHDFRNIFQDTFSIFIR